MDILRYRRGNHAFLFFHLCLATNVLTAFDFKNIGFVTPIGGLLLILGWALLGAKSWKHFGLMRS